MNNARRLMLRSAAALFVLSVSLTAAPSDAQAEVTACGICVPDVEAELYCFGHHQEYQFETACLNACGTPQTGTEIACADVPQLICDAGYSEVDCTAEAT